jgi:tRNA1(Val) A37 N6-methylase TrmN6
MDETTIGGLLGGKLHYRQLRTGHRTGFEPVLLAAAVPARAGERVLEAGTGAGAALLCLAARVPGVLGLGVERDAALARLAAENFAANGFAALLAVRGDVTALPFPAQCFDHVLANPPWFDEASTPSPDARRALAHQEAGAGLLERWVAALAFVLAPKGSLTLILPAASFARAASVLVAVKCGGVTLLPLWPRAGEAAKMVLLSARKGSKSPACVRPGLVLHDETGITPEAQAVLSAARAL